MAKASIHQDFEFFEVLSLSVLIKICFNNYFSLTGKNRIIFINIIYLTFFIFNLCLLFFGKNI